MKRLKFLWRGCRGFRGRWPDARPVVAVGIDITGPLLTQQQAVDLPGPRLAVAVQSIDGAAAVIGPVNRYEVLCDQL